MSTFLFSLRVFYEQNLQDYSAHETLFREALFRENALKNRSPEMLPCKKVCFTFRSASAHEIVVFLSCICVHFCKCETLIENFFTPILFFCYSFCFLVNHNRVYLKPFPDDPCSDYINASLIDVRSSYALFTPQLVEVKKKCAFFVQVNSFELENNKALDFHV